MLKLQLLSTLQVAQSQHGLRHEDYQRYRYHCTRKIYRLRTKIKLHHGKGTRFERKPLDDPRLFEKHCFNPPPQEIKGQEEASIDLERALDFLLMLVYEVERYWAYGMECKLRATDVARRKFHAFKKFKRASQMAQGLEQLVTSPLVLPRMDARSVLEVQVSLKVLLESE